MDAEPNGDGMDGMDGLDGLDGLDGDGSLLRAFPKYSSRCTPSPALKPRLPYRRINTCNIPSRETMRH